MQKSKLILNQSELFELKQLILQQLQDCTYADMALQTISSILLGFVSHHLEGANDIANFCEDALEKKEHNPDNYDIQVSKLSTTYLLTDLSDITTLKNIVTDISDQLYKIINNTTHIPVVGTVKLYLSEAIDAQIKGILLYVGKRKV